MHAPKDMYHAVLPIKIQCDKSEKLLFPLCRRCAETKQHECNHNEDERAFIGTWCTNELEKAIEKGYEVKKIYEVWHFEKTSDSLFKEYVSRFVKIKMESSTLATGPECLYKSDDHFKDVVKERLGIDLGQN